jgi:hypothetical protein
MMEAASTSETSVNFYQITRRTTQTAIFKLSVFYVFQIVKNIFNFRKKEQLKYDGAKV